MVDFHSELALSVGLAVTSIRRCLDTCG